MLVLYSFSAKDAFVQLEPLKTTVRSRIHAPVNFYVEYLESERFGIAGYQKALAKRFGESYSGKRIDLVVVVRIQRFGSLSIIAIRCFRGSRSFSLRLLPQQAYETAFRGQE